VTGIRRKLLAWYRRNLRKLPWRATKDPYRIWISEIMLQQTRVQTVIPFYERFLDRFPSVRHLARAKEDSVLKLWEGLGYYTRARHLHAAAREVVENYGAELPSSSERLRKLSGFGTYTSAAVASIAFEEPVAVVDGNVRRVVSRLFETDSGIDDTAQKMLDPKAPGDFNQAVMELGALICVPRSPRCNECPLSRECLAHLHRTIDRFPAARTKKKVKIIHAVAVVPRDGNRFFVVQRPRSGRWGGMWEFPTFESDKRVSIGKALSELKRKYGLKLEKSDTSGEFEHQLSHRQYKIRVVRAEGSGGSRKGGVWVTSTELLELSVSRLQRETFRRASSLETDSGLCSPRSSRFSLP
jgi:A/G-specific adenine glycosylase